MNEMTVRKYMPEDKNAVEEICYNCGYMGESPEFYWKHKVSFKEIWTTYYLNKEPGSCFVAVINNKVVGYLTGCLETSKAPDSDDIMKKAILKYKLFLKPGTAGFLFRGMFDSIIIRGNKKASGDFIDERWPSHLHINLLPEARGKGLAEELIRQWFELLKNKKSKGCHLGTIYENECAVHFFEKTGFHRYGDTPLLPGMRSKTGKMLHLQIMVISF